MYSVLLPAMKEAAILIGYVAAGLLVVTILAGIIYRAKLTELAGNILFRFPIFILTAFVSCTVWALAAREAGIMIIIAMPLLEAVAGYIYGSWLVKRGQGSIVGHFLYFPFIILTSACAAYLASQASSIMSRTDFNMLQTALLGVMLLAFSYLVGKASVLYFNELINLVKIWNQRLADDS